jgi:riboflavin kinase / FMN adenylyltransferase
MKDTPRNETFGARMATATLDWRDQPPSAFQGGVVSVGNFDGVHRGHTAVLAEARSAAKAVGAPVVVVTFDPHPLQLLAPERFQPLLTSVEHRAELLQCAGADGVVILRTTPELLRLDAVTFFRAILRDQMKARAVVEGFNFRFGHNRAGSNEHLKGWCTAAGIAFHEVLPSTWKGRPISSSRVREALQAGDIPTATELLNRPYRVAGRVGTGARRGRTIGFPTANLEDVQTLVPAEGVYAVRALLDGKSYGGAANIGPNPTFGEQARKLEVHLIDFDGDLYGRTLAVDFLARLRETRKFDSVDELRAQLQRDIGAARRMAASG